MNQRFHLTATTISSYFKHRCERLFRWNTVPTVYRGLTGIGWNVPKEKRSHSRAGIALLMQAGDIFEKERVQNLIVTVGATQVWHAGIGTERGREKVLPLSLSDFLSKLRTLPPPQYIAQVDFDLNSLPGAEESFLQTFGLDPQQFSVGPARPDLLEVTRPEEDTGPNRLRIWDFKASQAARHEHFIQVAYYSYLLETILLAADLAADFVVDTEFAVIHSFEGEEEFELAPYRLAVADFLRNQAPRILSTPATDAHYLVREKCALCEYMDTCQAEADAGSDLSRIPYISSESKRKLNENDIRSHRDLASITPENGYEELVAQLKTDSHDLSVNLSRYIATAQALEDGQERFLENTTLLIPRWDDIRVVLSAEQDPVTNTCFALGIKTFAWDRVGERPQGIEAVFISEGPDHEAELLLSFLETLNELLLRVDRDNRAIIDEPLENDPEIVTAQQAINQARAKLTAFKAAYPRLYKSDPQFGMLNARRETLIQAEKQAAQELRRAEKEARWQLQRRQSTLHFYVYDGLDLLILKSLVERHLFDANPALLAEIGILVRLFPPESLLPDADTFRTIPGTVVTQVLRKMVALPIPYIYDLRSVSEIYQPLKPDGEETGYRFLPRYGFGWKHSNQVAFERIHDYWNREDFVPDTRSPERVMTPTDIFDWLKRTVVDKLRATDSVIRRLKQDFGERFLLRKEPFRLHTDFDPLDFDMLEALRVFTVLEASLDELGVKHLHTLPVADRTSKFECIRGLRCLTGADSGDGTLWFTFDPDSRDAKFDVGDFNLVLTPEHSPETLLGNVDGRLFDTSRWRHEPYKVTLLEYDLQANPPRVRLQPKNLNKLRESIDLDLPCVLDRLYVDYNSPKVIDVMRQLQVSPESAQHIQELMATGDIIEWQPFIDDCKPIENELQKLVEDSGGDGKGFLNPSQWRAFRGAMQTPLSLIWGPPGTGKTYLLGHILLGYALVARRLQRPLRLLVTAFTHHAIGNVLKKTSELADQYGLDRQDLLILKAHGYHPHPADKLLPTGVERIREGDIASYVTNSTPVIVVGSTVWSVYKAMQGAREPGVVQPWFDVVLVDEASQMKLPDALIAFSASRPEANIILAGDDRQLPPIIHGTYPEDQAYLLTSVFAFMRHRLNERKQTDPTAEERALFQLEANFRMNEPLTAYPREMLYEGRFFSEKPTARISTKPDLPLATPDPLSFMLHPDRPVVLCWYESPTSFTARNPIEAELIALLTDRLSQILIDPRTDDIYQEEEFASEGLAILSPHRAQNSSIRQALAKLGFDEEHRPGPLVDTVDKLQGQERDVVFVSYGVADGEYAESEAAFLLSSNRFNVATTRPRHKLIVFCSSTVLNSVPDDRRVLLDSMMLKEFRRYCDSGLNQFQWHTPIYGDVILNIQWKGF